MRFYSIVIYSVVIFGLKFSAKAQTISKVNQTYEGNKIRISYRIVGAKFNQTFNVAVYVYSEGSKTFEGPLKEVLGDVGEVLTGGEKFIVWDIANENFTNPGKLEIDVRMIIEEAPIPNRFYLGFNGNTSAPYGLTVGQTGKMGWYVRTSFNSDCFTESTFQTNNEVLLDYTGDGYYVYNGASVTRRMTITTGLNFRLIRDVFYLYLGAGYGEKSLLWQVDEYDYADDSKISDYWAKHYKYSFTGIEGESGLLFIKEKLFFSVGVTSLPGKQYDASFGLGLSF